MSRCGQRQVGGFDSAAILPAAGSFTPVQTRVARLRDGQLKFIDRLVGELTER